MLEERFELAGVESGTSFSGELESVRRSVIWQHGHCQNPAVFHTSCKTASHQTLLLAPILFLNALLKITPERTSAKPPHWEAPYPS